MSTSTAEAAVSYAALILADAEVAITPEKLQTLLKAAGIEDVEPIWTTLFAKALKDKNVKEILTTVITSGPAKGPGDDAADKDKENGGNKGDADEQGTEIKGDESGDGEESDEDLGNLFDL
ncbi:60S acidic ribosomal protein-like protein P1 [Lophiostoma macrostomum CBS 122681]|uniref:Large ribosomal subunit protein P1 n=1 Tax=Lophiostoma macrostomum CBS 122681 TaxID=1314788 RepID=A0A6A6TBV8_9PLEO|nr:60S acidic ribosomal protein-like protein P1 [Lophiostoma macrostomum CBS 122681]